MPPFQCVLCESESRSKSARGSARDEVPGYSSLFSCARLARLCRLTAALPKGVASRKLAESVPPSDFTQPSDSCSTGRTASALNFPFFGSHLRGSLFTFLLHHQDVKAATVNAGRGASLVLVDADGVSLVNLAVHWNEAVCLARQGVSYAERIPGEHLLTRSA